jgi:hypothetical protein
MMFRMLDLVLTSKRAAVPGYVRRMRAGQALVQGTRGVDNTLGRRQNRRQEWKIVTGLGDGIGQPHQLFRRLAVVVPLLIEKNTVRELESKTKEEN